MGLLRAFNVGNILHVLRNNNIIEKCIVYKCVSFRACKVKLGSFSQISAVFFPVSSVIFLTKEKEVSMSQPNFQWHTVLEYSKLYFCFWISFPFPHVRDYSIISSIIRGSSISFHRNDDLQFKLVSIYKKKKNEARR